MLRAQHWCWVVLVAATGCQGLDEAVDGTSSSVGMLDRKPPLEGFRWESALGVQIAVPSEWKINDIIGADCLISDAPTFVRAPSYLGCASDEPSTKQVIEIKEDRWLQSGEQPNLRFQEIHIGALLAERGEGVMPDGRATGWLHIPEIGVVIDVRVHDDDLLRKVFDSVRVVDVDHNACATSRKNMGALAPTATTLVPSTTSALSVCWFDRGDTLQASSLIEGAAAEAVVSALNQMKPGRNIDLPENVCLREGGVPAADTVLVAHAAGDGARLEMTFSTCTHRGLSNGREDAQLTETLMNDIMRPLQVGYHWSPSGLR